MRFIKKWDKGKYRRKAHKKYTNWNASETKFIVESQKLKY